MASSVCPVDQRKAALRVLQVLQQIAAPRFFTSKYVPGLEELHPDVRNAFTNAVVDGSLVAIRAFNEFLIPKKKYPDDLHWSDFPGFAQQVQFLSVDSNKELHKSVAHLSSAYIETEMAFPAKKFILPALPSMLAFCDYLLTSNIAFIEQEKAYIGGTRESFLRLEEELETEA